MSVFTVSAGVIPLLDQTVVVNGQRQDTVWCTAIRRGVGAGASGADFRMPGWFFDTARGHLRDALVSVSVHDAETPAQVDFVGYLDVDTATLSSDDDSVSLTANSVTAYLGKIYVGQLDRQATVVYRLRDPMTGASTNVTPKRVLEHLFANMPTYYAARVKLGDTSVLATTAQNQQPELVFRGTTYADAIEQVVALFGDVSYTERPDGSAVRLDFFRIQSPSAPSTRAAVGTWTDAMTSGVNVIDLQRNQSTVDATTRVIAYGAPKRYIISIPSQSEVDGQSLLKLWDLTLEDAVLADPKSAAPGSPGYVPGMEHVFRRWGLPHGLRGLTVLRDLGVYRVNGTVYSAQVWKYPSVITADENGDLTGELSAEAILLKSVQLNLDEGYFTLPVAEDAMNLMGASDNGDGTIEQLWNVAPIGITIAVEGPECLYADVSQPSDVGLDFRTDGLVEMLQRDDLIHVQYTNDGSPFGGVVWPAMIFNEDFGGWAVATEATIVASDGAILRACANEILKAKCRRHVSYDATLVRFSRAYLPGKRLQVTGLADGVPSPLMVTQVTWDLDANTTGVIADNVKPPVRRDLTRHMPVAVGSSPQESAAAAEPMPLGEIEADFEDETGVDEFEPEEGDL